MSEWSERMEKALRRINNNFPVSTFGPGRQLVDANSEKGRLRRKVITTVAKYSINCSGIFWNLNISSTG